MEIRFLNQPKDIRLGEVLNEKLMSKNYTKVWIFAGFVKDSGLDYLYDAIKVAREEGVIVECVFGVDKKNTSKDMFLKLLDLGCKIRFHINDDSSKLETRIYAFESDAKESYIYLTGSKLSDGGLTENISLITEIKYLPADKREFNKVKLSVEDGLNTDKFETMTRERLKELASTGEILARITERRIPSISELYNLKETDMVVQEYDESASSKYKDLANKEFDIAIDFPSDTDVRVQDSFGEEVEHKIKQKVTEKSESKIVSKLILGNENFNYDMMNVLIIPTSKVTRKGATAGEIKISSTIAINMGKFFGYPSNFHIEQDGKGKLREKKKIKLDVFENVSGEKKYDGDAELIKTEKNMIIKSQKLAELEINENDIMRLIKQDDDTYKCEIIKQESTEYNVWQNFCTISIKGTNKKFGIT